VAERPRILVLGSPPLTGSDWWQRCLADADAAHAETWASALDLLNRQPFDALVVSPGDTAAADALRVQLLAQRILGTLTDGIALVDFDLKIRWANPTFTSWCKGPCVGRGFYEALGSPQLVGTEYCPFHSALGSRPTSQGPAPIAVARLHCSDNRDLEVQITPLPDSGGQMLLIAQVRDISSSVQQQNKLAALYQAGRQLAALAPEQLADMTVAERIDLLKLNIRRFTRDLLHYEVIEIRLLNPQTGCLEPLLDEGMAADAVSRTLSPGLEGQGVTGYVAATARSYLCPDTRHDPHYLEGSPGAHSSLTVPLMDQDRVIGTLNVESPRPNAFTAEDLQFAEVFSREIADALHTLELLNAEKRSTVTQSIEAVNREIALPVDDILAATTTILDRYIGHEPEIADKLRRILVNARLLKQTIQKVGEDIAPGKPAIVSPQPIPPKLRGLRVLVADNDDRVRRSAHSLLGRWGCVVETARDGQEALTMARLGNYDAILADIRLPDLTGYEVYRKLREAQPLARVILMTGYGYDPTHSLVKARQDGLRHVLFKPFRVDQLLDALSSPDPPTTPPVEERDGHAKVGTVISPTRLSSD
jgi:two-component system, sensor histidine kinase SagS